MKQFGIFDVRLFRYFLLTYYIVRTAYIAVV